MDGLAVGAIAAVLMVLAAALTLLPAMLGFVGRAIDRLHVPACRSGLPRPAAGFWYRWSRTVQRRPVDLRGSRPAGAGGAGPAAVLHAAGVLRCRQRPTPLTTRQAYDLLARVSGPDSTAHSSLRPTSRPDRAPRAERPSVPSTTACERPGRGLGHRPRVQRGRRRRRHHRLPDHLAPGGPDRIAGSPPARRGDPAGRARHAA